MTANKLKIWADGFFERISITNAYSPQELHEIIYILRQKINELEPEIINIPEETINQLGSTEGTYVYTITNTCKKEQLNG